MADPARTIWRCATLATCLSLASGAPATADAADGGAPGFAAMALAVDETAADAAYAGALALLEDERHADALAALRRLQALHPSYSRLSAVQTRIAVLQESRDAGRSLSAFLGALDARDAGDLERALIELDRLVSSWPDSPLLDDALYLGAYLQVMDGYDFAQARERLDRLATRFPDSAYADSAAYLAAIVKEQLGDTAGARDALVVLRDRHTALGLPFGFRWPVGTLLSRYWFDRAERRISIIDARLRRASRIDDARPLGDGRLRVSVNVDGLALELLLEPSALVGATRWRDGARRDRLPPTVGVYEGEVVGNPDSWVRATIEGGAISGMIGLNGVRMRLLPDHLEGTLDYYQPSRRGPAIGAAGGLDPTDAGLAEHLQAIDLLVAPPRAPEGVQRRARETFSATRQVPLSIVIDSRFDAYHGGSGLARALEYLNVADGVYRAHGLSLALDEAVVLDDVDDPLKLAPGTLESILRRFRDYRLARDVDFGDSAATYLFTGNHKTDPTLGLAWIDTLCRTDGYDVGVTTPSSFGDVLLTHELGHSFGAQHDSDTACSADRDGLMWPHISSRTGTRLTDCSQDSVRSSRARACLANAVDLTLGARLDPGAAVFSASHADAALAVPARLVVEAGRPGQIDWPAGCRVLTPTSADCAIDAIAPRERREIVLPLTALAARGGSGFDEPITARLSPVGPAELSPGDNLATTDGSTPVAVPDSVLAGVSDNEVPRLDPAAGGAGVDAGEPGPPASGQGGGAAGPLLGVVLGGLLCLRRRARVSLRTRRLPSRA